jgi:hypothetical protein
MDVPNMVSNDSQTTDQLLHCMQSKLELIERLYELTCQQMECLETTEVERLLSVLGQKQCVFDQLQDLRQSLEPMLAIDPDQRSWSSEVRRQECRELVGQCGTRMREILTMEEASIGRLNERKQLISDQLGSIANISRMDNAYRQQQMMNTASVLDLSNE